MITKHKLCVTQPSTSYALYVMIVSTQ